MDRTSGERLGIADGDWVKVISAHSTITAQAKLMDGVNWNTVWCLYRKLDSEVPWGGGRQG